MKELPRIKLKKAERKRCEEFADERCKDSDLYQKRGGFKREDVLAGAMAEVAVYTFLRSKGIKVGKPDFSLYDAGSKSYEADLSFENKKFHVKGQTYQSSQRYGRSWLMQKNDPLVRCKEDKKIIINNYLVPCVVDLGGNEVHILGLPSFTALHSHQCFSEPALESFKRTKVAIYADTLNWALSDKALWGVIRKIGERL